jgi:hypothetical protein
LELNSDLGIPMKLEPILGNHFGRYFPIKPNLGPIFHTFFPGKILGKIPRKNLAPKMVG